MVTGRELVIDFSRIIFTLLSLLFSFAVGIYLILRVTTGDQFWPVALANNFAFYCLIPLLCIVPFCLVTRAKWGLVASVPFAIIFLVWFGPYFLPKSVSLANGQTLKAVTFNYYQGNGQADVVRSWILQTDADVILFQEVPTYQFIPILLTTHTRYPYAATQAAIGAKWGNVFLSRYPILDQERLSPVSDIYPNTQQRYLVDVGGHHVAFYNVDVPLAYSTPRFDLPFVGGFLAEYATGYNDDVRNIHIERIMARVARETVPYIVAGDFNMSEQAALYSELSSHMKDSFREAGTGLGTTWPVSSAGFTLPSFMPALVRVDYIWHSPELRTVSARVGVPMGSDHLPVYAELEILPG